MSSLAVRLAGATDDDVQRTGRAGDSSGNVRSTELPRAWPRAGPAITLIVAFGSIRQGPTKSFASLAARHLSRKHVHDRRGVTIQDIMQASIAE